MTYIGTGAGLKSLNHPRTSRPERESFATSTLMRIQATLRLPSVPANVSCFGTPDGQSVHDTHTTTPQFVRPWLASATPNRTFATVPIGGRHAGRLPVLKTPFAPVHGTSSGTSY